MQIKIILPDLGAAPMVLSCWFADQGETVFSGDRLVEIAMDGATFDVSAPATGRLVEKSAFPREPLQPGQILGIVDAEEEG